MYPGRFGPGGPFEGSEHFGWHLLAFGVSSLFWLVLLGLLAWALVRFFTRRRRYTPTPLGAQPMPSPFGDRYGGAPSAIETLRRRYAAGEIDTETYDAMLERIGAPEPEQPNPTLL